MVPRLYIWYIVSVILIIDRWSWSQAELFTAISEVEPLLVTHKRIIDDLDDYVQKEERRLSVLKRHLDLYKKEHEKAMEDIPNYLGNPINAFTLIKRLTTDLDLIENSIKIGTEYIKNITMNHDDVKYPTLEDLTGAANALTRLQDTYHLDVKELAEGMLNGVQYSTSMTAGDCYELGRALYNEKDFKNALSWMMEALRKYREENNDDYPFTEVDILEYISFAHYLLGEYYELGRNFYNGNDFKNTLSWMMKALYKYREERNSTYSFTEADIMEYISFSHYLLDDVQSALDWTKKLLEIEPKHTRARGNVPHYQKSLKEQQEKMKRQRRGETGDREDDERPRSHLTTYAKERKTYESLCRGEVDIPSEIANKLTCRYLTENHPFLRLAPFKMEQKYIDPDVFVFHEVMSDEEIEHIMDMAKPRFKRAVVHDPKTGELVPAHYRISKSGWLKDEESEVIARVSRRITDFTGLSLASAEELQVVNYGIGGHYEPHYDFARKHENAFSKFNGNRIATVLFYMSDVAQGGATVFTELGLSVFPKKGSALFWFNLHPSGEGDLATRHAACPVLRGSKWVSNKWIHQGGQELIKPCNLEYQEEAFIRKIPRPVPISFR